MLFCCFWARKQASMFFPTWMHVGRIGHFRLPTSNCIQMSHESPSESGTHSVNQPLRLSFSWFPLAIKSYINVIVTKLYFQIYFLLWALPLFLHDILYQNAERWNTSWISEKLFFFIRENAWQNMPLELTTGPVVVLMCFSDVEEAYIFKGLACYLFWVCDGNMIYASLCPFLSHCLSALLSVNERVLHNQCWNEDKKN